MDDELRALETHGRELRFTENGIVIVRLLSYAFILSTFVLAFFLGVLIFLLGFLAFPGEVSSGLTFISLLAAIIGLPTGVALWLQAWRKKVISNRPTGRLLESKSATLIPWSDVGGARIANRRILLLIRKKLYLATTNSPEAQTADYFKQKLGDRLAIGFVTGAPLIRRGRRIGTISSSLLVVTSASVLIVYYFPIASLSTVLSIVSLFSLFGLLSAVEIIANSESGDWRSARDYSVIGNFLFWFGFGILAGALNGLFPAQTAEAGVLVRAAPLYVPPSIPKDFPGIAVYTLQFIFLIAAALFLLRSYTAVSARVRSPWFRVAGLSYLFSVVLVGLTGVSISLIFLCLQTVAFLSISVDNQENQAQAAAR